MKKLFTATAIAMALAGTSSVMAEETTENTLFAGGEFGMAKTELSFGSGALEKKDNKQFSQFGGRVGMYINENVRVYASVLTGSGAKNSFAVEGKGSAEDITGQEVKDADLSMEMSSELDSHLQLGASVDYLFDFDLPVKPFVGATLGYQMSTLKTTFAGKASKGGRTIEETNVSDTSDLNSLAIGAQVGVLYEVGPVDVELGYRFMAFSTEVQDGDSEGMISFGAKNTQTPYLSASYRF